MMRGRTILNQKLSLVEFHLIWKRGHWKQATEETQETEDLEVDQEANGIKRAFLQSNPNVAHLEIGDEAGQETGGGR